MRCKLEVKIALAAVLGRASLEWIGGRMDLKEMTRSLAKLGRSGHMRVVWQALQPWGKSGHRRKLQVDELRSEALPSFSL